MDNGKGFGRVFRTVRILQPEGIPPVSKQCLDVAILDMHHDWPNLGHDSLVKAVGEIALDLGPFLESTGMCIRVLSYDVRKNHMIPELPGGRLQLYLGSGGPGHIDPHKNDGISEGTQGIREDASWERPLFRLFDAVYRDERSALLAVCHSFGVLCRWAGVARPVLRGPEKGGKSAGVLENVLTAQARRHPWFALLSARLPDGERLRIIDSRLYDLIPNATRYPDGMTPIGHETVSPAGGRGEALTMLEFARDPAGVMPRVFGVNHHPEIRDRLRQRWLLERKFSRGDVPLDWYQERVRTLNQAFSSEESETWFYSLHNTRCFRRCDSTFTGRSGSEPKV